VMKIKVCGLTDPDNIRALAEAKPDFAGFIFYPPSARFVGNEPDLSLFDNVPSGTKKVGVFVNEKITKVCEVVRCAGLDLVQLHGDESPQLCSQLKSSGLVIIKAFNVGREFSFDSIIQYLPVCDYFLFDTKSEKQGGSGQKFDWGNLDNYTLDKPFFLSGGIGPDDLEEIGKIANRTFYAVDINSRFETAAGIKDAALVKRFINEIKNDRI
jgi:phosphoribosylanthranilate isomerase